ncbi:type VI secretion system protein TssA [Pseudophaeobacter sp.]|jgi:type VI secretion system protein ImpA|uniref:type VI secretion system protein TssA n=1 Tax=Pseudophaeobacter sp. TaxID=1971739 RepID=UPI0032D95AC0
MDLAVFLQSIGEESPSGDNLVYDPAFAEMERAAQPLTDDSGAGTPADFATVEEKALEVLERSHELRAAVFLAEALLARGELVGFADVTSYMRGCLEQFWDTCHPELDEDDGDAIMRMNAVQDLCGKPGEMAGPSPVYSALRRVYLSDSRNFGRFSLRDIEIAEGQMSAPEDMETIPDQASIGAAFQDSDDDFIAARLAAVELAEANIKAISDVFSEQTPGQGPELDPLMKQLRQMAKRLRDYGNLAEPAEDEDNDAGEEAGAAEAAPAAAGGARVVAAPGAINSPTDVANTLDRIIAYYQREEPSSPLPLLLERAKRLVGADFLTIVNDMAPRGLENVQLIGGLEDDD